MSSKIYGTCYLVMNLICGERLLPAPMILFLIISCSMSVRGKDNGVTVLARLLVMQVQVLRCCQLRIKLMIRRSVMAVSARRSLSLNGYGGVCQRERGETTREMATQVQGQHGAEIWKLADERCSR